MTAHAKTIETARANGFRIRFIDDDCMILSRDDVEIQVSYDAYSPSYKFVSAVTIETEVRFTSYAQVRTFMEEV